MLLGNKKIASFAIHHPYRTSFFLGVILLSSLPPIHFFIGLPIAISGFLWLLSHLKTTKSSWLLGWWFGFGFFVSGLYWFAHALMTEPDRFAWLIPFAVLGIPAVLAGYFSLMSYLLFKMKLSKVNAVIFMALLWGLLEYFRGILLSGFPWNALGYCWLFSDHLSQLASIIGVYGLSVLAVFVGGIPFLLSSQSMRGKRNTIVLLIIGFLLSYYWGEKRIDTTPLQVDLKDKTVRIVQGNISQSHKWDPYKRLKHFDIYQTLSKRESKSPIDYLVWPETAFPFLLETEPVASLLLKRLIPKDTLLITGGLERSNHKTAPQLWNVLYVVNSDALIIDRYRKHHLVPFGEYVPFRHWLPLSKITQGTIDFSRGTGPKTMPLNDSYFFSPLICYEVIFSNHVKNQEHLPTLLINVTNDAWFGVSLGPYQHLAMAKMRSIEEGLPLIRAANTGISAVFDAFGQEIAKTTLNQKTVLDVNLPKPLINQTFFSRYGYKPFHLISGFLVFFYGVISVRFKRSNIQTGKSTP